MKTTVPGRSEIEMFPYAAEFECRNCGQGFQLEPGDPWDRIVADSAEGDYAAATCPNPACGLRVCLLNNHALPWARTPVPAPAIRERPRPQRRHVTVRADEGDEIIMPIGDDDAGDPGPLPDWRESGRPYEETLRPRAIVAGVERRGSGHGG